jgi:hypothetical protein
MGWCIREHEAGEGGWRPKHRIRAASGAPLKTAIGGDRAGSQGGAYEAAAVMGWCIREHEAGEGGWRPKHRIRAAMARFRVCRAKQRRMEVEGGRGVACMMRRRLRSDTFVMRGGGRGLGPPIQNRARRLSFGLHQGINGWDGDLWHQISLYHSNLRDGELIVSWLRWNEGFCSPGYLHPSSLLSHTLIHSHLAPLLLSHPRSPRTCQVMAQRPRIWC